MSTSFAYDAPTVNQFKYEMGVGLVTGTGVGGYLLLPYAATLYNVASNVTTLGTSASGLKVVNIVSGTTTTAYGTFTQGTAAVDTVSYLNSTGGDGTLTGTSLAAGTILRVTGVTDTVGAAAFAYLIKPAATASFG